MTRRKIHRAGQVVFAAAPLIGLAFPATRYAAMAAFIAGALLTAATVRPADRGKS